VIEQLTQKLFNPELHSSLGETIKKSDKIAAQSEKLSLVFTKHSNDVSITYTYTTQHTTLFLFSFL
jgi:hypothetical protein